MGEGVNILNAWGKGSPEFIFSEKFCFRVGVVFTASGPTPRFYNKVFVHIWGVKGITTGL